MKAKIFFVIFICFACSTLQAQQARAFDTTIKIGKAGYRVRCNNKKPNKNSLNVNPIGFESGARDADIEIKGRIAKAEVDDLNNDGFPDMVLYIFNANDKNKGNVIGISSNKNEGLAPMIFPDIMDDVKLRVGYMGQDEFQLVQGTLLRRFPIYNNSDTSNIRLTGSYRQIQYRIVAGERGILRFIVLRTYDIDKSKQ